MRRAEHAAAAVMRLPLLTILWKRCVVSSSTAMSSELKCVPHQVSVVASHSARPVHRPSLSDTSSAVSAKSSERVSGTCTPDERHALLSGHHAARNLWL